MIYYVDIDNTICVTAGLGYEKAQPIPEAIAKVNALFDAGNIIIIWTSRGVGGDETQKGFHIRCNRLHTFTVAQLQTWGVKYHLLRMDKPYFDILFDDRAQPL